MQFKKTDTYTGISFYQDGEGKCISVYHLAQESDSYQRRTIPVAILSVLDKEVSGN